MRKELCFIPLAIGAVLAFSNPAQAQNPNCGDHTIVTTRLADRYGETRQMMALNTDQSVLEVFASDETGSWTITITTAGGPTCIVAAGQNYQYMAEALPPQGSDA